MKQHQHMLVFDNRFKEIMYMRNLKERWKRKAAIGLTAIMLTVQLPFEVFAEETGPVVIQEITAASEFQEQSEIQTGDETPVEAAVPGETSLPAEAADNDSEEKKTPAFKESRSVDGVTVTVEAEEGVFPEGAALYVKKVTAAQEKQAEEAVENERSNGQNVAVSYTYDIKVLDKDGSEIRPADQSKVKLSFTLDEVADENLTTNVYHIKEDAEKLPVETTGDTAIAETDGFSLYTVEFTYDKKQYVLPGDSRVALSDILKAVELSGEASAVEVSDESLFSADKENGKWVITAHKAFSTTEWMKVLIDGVEYEITVTDDQEIGSWAELQDKINNNASTEAEHPTTITLSGNVTAGEGDSALVIPEGKYVTLDLNGHTIDRGLADQTAVENGNVITVNGSLTLTDSSDNQNTSAYDGTGKITGGNTTSEGGGVLVNSGTFNMEGGTISDCSANHKGGGVLVQGGTFTMSGGTIDHCNAADSGGGVHVDGCTFTMSGGTITYCNAGIGGGVCVTGSPVEKGMFIMESGTITGCNAVEGGGVYVSYGTFTMKGGTISACTAIPPESLSSGGTCLIYGGGVCVNKNGTFTMEGGTISACTANSPVSPSSDVTYMISGGGVYVDVNGAFNISGAPVIRDNKNKKDNSDNNVVLDGGKTITVTSALTTSAELHINADKGITVAQIGSPRTASLTVTEAGYFKSDINPNLLGGLNDAGNVVFKEPLPELTGASNLTYNGTEQTPALTFSGDPAPALTEGTDYTVSYKKVDGSTGTALIGAPKDAGTYKAVAAGKGSYIGTSEASFTIAPKPVTVGGIKAKNKVYDTTTTAELDCSGATFAGKVDGDRLTVSGTGTFDNKNASKDKTVTISGLTLGGDSKDNYVLAESGHQATATATITRATPEVTAPTASATYMENLSNVGLNNPTGNLSGTWTWATDNGINPNETAVGTVGTHVFRAKFTPTDTANYCEITKDVTVTVGKATPHLTIVGCSAPYGHPVSVKSTCDSDGEVTYVFYKSGSVTKTNTEDGAETEGGPPKNAGTYNIVASVAETSNYLSDEQTLANGCVIFKAPNPAVLRSTVTVKRGSDYDLSGLVSGAKGTVSFALKEPKNDYSLSGSTLTLADNADSSCTITVTADGTVDGKSNYETFTGEITVNATDLLPQDSFGFADVAQEKTYGDGDFTVAATGAETGSNVTYSSTNSEVATVEAETGKVHILNAGKATITANAGATDTYASAAASYKLTVYPKPVTISGIKADDLVYDSAIARGITLNTGGAEIAGKVDGDDLTVSAIGMCDADAGENKTVTIRTITLGGSSAGNYTVDEENSQQTTTINITKADIPYTAITAPTEKNGLVYTGLAQPLVNAETASDGEMRYALGTDTTAPADNLYSASIPTAVNAGTYYVWYMVKGDRNHNDYKADQPVTVSIRKASGGTTINADAVELQKGNNITASVNISGYVGAEAVIKDGESPQVTPNNDPGIQITDINVSNDNLTFKVSSVKGGNAIITVTLTSGNYDGVTLTIPVKVQDKVTEVKLEAPPSNVTSAVQSVEVKGLSDYTQNQNTPSSEPVKVVLDVKPVSSPQDSGVGTKIDYSVKAIFKGVGEGNIKTEYLDIKITKQVGTDPATSVGDVGRVLELAIKYDLSGKFHPVVIREHEGSVTAFTSLNAQPSEGNYQDGTFYIDEDQGIVYIYSRYFSTFSIASSTVNSHTVSFDAQGGSSVDPIIAADGGKISPPPTSTRSGYTLDGWFTFASGGEKLTRDTVITADITYYAQWTKNSSGGGGGGGGGGTPTTVAVTGVTVSPKTAAITLSENKAVQFTATVEPENATDKTVTWSQSSTDGGEVVLGSETDNPVTVTAAKAGTVTLTATSTDGSWTDTATITITEAEVVPVTGVEVTPAEVELLKGETLKLNAKVMPEDATDKTVTWASSDTTKVTVTEDGVIEAVAAGTAAVTATAGEATGSVTVTVTEDKAKEKVIEETEEETKTEIAEDLGGGRISDLIGTDPSDTGTVVTVDKDGNITDTKVWVGGIESGYKYTGKSITPEPHVYDGTTKLVKGTDYTVSYKNNKTAGKASLTVRFKGNYKNEPRTVSFEIRPAELGEDVIVTAAAQEAGKAVKPGLTYVMKATGAAIAPGKFGVNPVGKITIPEGGKQEVTVTAKDTVNFTGTAVVGIEAAPKAKLINKAMVTISPKSYTYTGGEIVPEEKAYTVKLGGTVLKYGTDYRIAEILGNVEPGKATVILEGAGDYKGSSTENFTISKGFDLTKTDKAVILVNGEEKASVKYAKGGVTPDVAVYLNGLKLVKGTDYTLKFSGNKAVGKSAEVKVTFKGKYKGEKTASFEIEPQELDELSVVAEDKIKSNKADFYKNPKLTITDLNGKKLGKNDYTVGNDYKYDEEKGEVKVALKGKGNYSGEEYKLVYRVIAKDQDIKGASAAKIADKAYTGRAIELTDSDLAGRLKLGGKTLTPGEDFEIDEESYRNNVNTGEASVVIRGKGTMGGVKTLKFKIVQKPVNWNGAYTDGKFSR